MTSKLPSLDPSEPEIFRRIVETAAEERGRRMAESAARRMEEVKRHKAWAAKLQPHSPLQDGFSGLEGSENQLPLHPEVDRT